MPETGALAWKKSLLGTKTKKKTAFFSAPGGNLTKGIWLFLGFIYIFVSLFFWNCVQIECRGHYFHP